MNDFNPFPPGDGPTCPECGAELTQAAGGARRTLMVGSSGYDGDGTYHNHDPNWDSAVYECENGHKVRHRTRKACPAKGCGYGGESEVDVID